MLHVYVYVRAYDDICVHVHCMSHLKSIKINLYINIFMHIYIIFIYTLFQPLILPEMHAWKHHPGTFQKSAGPQRNIKKVGDVDLG